MTLWQRRARLAIAISALGFAAVVVFALKKRDAQPSSASAERTDPSAVVEVTGGRVERFRLSREDVRVAYERQLTYADGATKLIGVTITADERAGGRTFTVTGNEGSVGQNESLLQLNGDVRLTASDGLAVRTDHATYSDKDGSVRSTGRVEFSRERLTGSGTGLVYDTVRDALVISNQAVVHVVPDERGMGAVEIASGSATFSRGPAPGPGGQAPPVEGQQRNIRFDGDVKLQRDGQNMEADTAVAYLTPDEKQIRLMELRGRSRIAIDNAVTGGLKEMTGRDIDLTYGADGHSIDRAAISGDGVIVLAGAAENAGRRIAANSIDVSLAPDGSTPVFMSARESVMLTLPAERTVPARTIEADVMESSGEAPRGLTQARFTGDVEYRETSASFKREASAATLDVALEPGMAGFREAKFSRRVHFVDGEMTSDAAEGRYDLSKGVLELTGSEPGLLRPRVVNARLTIDATRVDVTLEGPHLRAEGDVKSVVRPASKADEGQSGRLPSMFKQDRPINVTAEALEYNGVARKATYRGNAQLWQDDASLKGGTIVLDDAAGDLTAENDVTTVNVRNVVTAGKKPERKRSISTASSFSYQEAERRATYTGNAHMNSTDGDITAARIELYLKPPASSGTESTGAALGDDLERAEAFDSVTLKDQNRTTTGNHLVYTTADERYVITGTPVKVIDECRRETIGRTLTYLKSAETITIDGNEQTRTQTKGSAQCP